MQVQILVDQVLYDGPTEYSPGVPVRKDVTPDAQESCTASCLACTRRVESCLPGEPVPVECTDSAHNGHNLWNGRIDTIMREFLEGGENVHTSMFTNTQVLLGNNIKLPTALLSRSSPESPEQEGDCNKASIA